jgi:phage gpG-like protein
VRLFSVHLLGRVVLMNAKRFSAVMRKMAKIPSQQAAAISRDLKKEIERSMDASQDPYGKPWQATSNGGRTQLKKSGRGRASIVVAPTAGAGIRITVGKLYMVFHQFGGKSHLRGHKKHPDFGRDRDQGGKRNRPPKRSFLPFDVMPSRWSKIILKRYQSAAAELLR